MIKYIGDSVVIKPNLKKPCGNTSAMYFDDGEGLKKKPTPFDTFVQFIQGKAETSALENQANRKRVNIF